MQFWVVVIAFSVLFDTYIGSFAPLNLQVLEWHRTRNFSRPTPVYITSKSPTST